MGIAYKLNDFLDACANPRKVTVSYDAKRCARIDFNIFTEKNLIAFISLGGLEDLQYINTKPWDNNPKKPPDIDVDAYSFFSGKKYGYIAFMFIPLTDKWRIKSFKKNMNPNPREIKADLRHLPFEGLSQVIDIPVKEK